MTRSTPYNVGQFKLDTAAANEKGQSLELVIKNRVIQEKEMEARKIKNKAAFDSAKKDCEATIKDRYNNSTQDKYGNSSGTTTGSIYFYQTYQPGMHKYGNNNALFYQAIVDRNQNGRLVKREAIQLYCVVSFDGKIVGLERSYK